MASFNNKLYTTTATGTYYYDPSEISSSGFAVSSSYYDKDLSYDNVMSQISNENLPVIDKEIWDKVSNMLSSSDVELIKLGFQLMSGYRFPPGVINLTIIHKAINKYLKEINK